MTIDECTRTAGALHTLEEAISRIQTVVQAVAETETIALRQAAGRILAESVISPIAMPRERNAAMDGYAWMSRDLLDHSAFRLRLVGTSWAGKPFEGDIQPGECVRIFTGAVVPESADSVSMQEQVNALGMEVEFPPSIKSLQNIRQIGEELNPGDQLLDFPRKLSMADIGLLASAGIERVTVSRQLKIAYLSTGDELMEMGTNLTPGKLYDSNRIMLGGLLADPCHLAVDLGIIPDDQQLLEQCLIKAAHTHDVIISTGGASVGEADHIETVLRRCGQVDFWKLAIKPGKPLAFGRIGNSYFFGLPGNPVAVMVTFQQIVQHALNKLSGAKTNKPLRMTALCSTALKKQPGRKEFQRGILSQNDEGEFWVASTGQQGSHMLSSLSHGNCYIVLPESWGNVSVGTQVMVEPFSLSLATC